MSAESTLEKAEKAVDGAEKAVAAFVAWALGLIGTVVTAGVLHGTALRYVAIIVSVLTGIASVCSVYETRNSKAPGSSPNA